MTKTELLAAMLAVCCVGCKPEMEDDLTPQLVAQIKIEVAANVDSIVTRLNRLDDAGTLAYYADTPDFILLGVDGVRFDAAGLRKATQDFVSGAASNLIKTKVVDCKVQTSDLAICAWQGDQVTTMKNGDKLTFGPDAVTLIFKRVGGAWKVIYSHESATIATTPAAKAKGKK